MKEKEEFIYKLLSENSSDNDAVIYAAKLAAKCYHFLEDSNTVCGEKIFTTPEVLAATMQIAYQEIQTAKKEVGNE